MSNIITLGQSVRVSDPCYSPDTWCSLLLSTVLPGQYEVKIDNLSLDGWGRRVAYLTAVHVDHTRPGHPWEDYATIGVDSGQAGIFDESTYRNKASIDGLKLPEGDWNGLPFIETDEDHWYDAMCTLTINNSEGWGHYSQGVVSRSGIGDGMYPVQVMYDKEDTIVGIRIDFLLAEDDEEDDEYTD